MESKAIITIEQSEDGLNIAVFFDPELNRKELSKNPVSHLLGMFGYGVVKESVEDFFKQKKEENNG